MKRKILIAASICAAALSCQKNDVEATQDGVYDLVSFSISASETATKSEGTADEKKVNDLSVFVFHPDGSLNGQAYVTNETSCSVRLKRGAGMICYALVNMGSLNLNAISTETELKAVVSRLGANSATSFHMVGRDVLDLSTNSSASIAVRRFASKVTVDAVTKNFSSSVLNSKEAVLTGIYLINVNGSCLVSGELPQSATFLNGGEYKTADNTSTTLSLGSYGLNYAFPESSYSTSTSMYCYANPTLESNDNPKGDVSKRMTRLVIEITWNNKTYFYPINIGDGTDKSLHANTHYRIKNVVISALGSENPDILPPMGSITFNIQVENWADEITDSVIF